MKSNYFFCKAYRHTSLIHPPETGHHSLERYFVYFSSITATQRKYSLYLLYSTVEYVGTLKINVDNNNIYYSAWQAIKKAYNWVLTY